MPLFPFFFWRLLALVNVDRIKRKLPSLLMDNPKLLEKNNCSSKNKKGWTVYMRSRYQVQQFKEKNPEKFNTLMNKVIADLNELEKAVSNGS